MGVFTCCGHNALLINHGKNYHSCCIRWAISEWESATDTPQLCAVHWCAIIGLKQEVLHHLAARQMLPKSNPNVDCFVEVLRFRGKSKLCLMACTHDQKIVWKKTISKRSYDEVIISTQLSRANHNRSSNIIQWKRHNFFFSYNTRAYDFCLFSTVRNDRTTH